MKKILAAAALVMMIMSLPGEIGPSYADKNAPPDETIPENPSQSGSGSSESDVARVEREKKEAAKAKAKKDEESRRARERAAAEAKKKEAARRAEDALRTAEAARVAASEDQANRALQTGMNFMAEGRYQSALNIFRGYVGSNPHSADAWYWISRAHHALGDYDRAQTAANIALEIDPYYGPLTKSPSGLEPMPPLSRQQKKEPRPSMSVLPVKQPLPVGIALEPVTISFPYLVRKDSEAVSGDAEAQTGAYLSYAPYPPMRPGRSSRWMAASERFNEISRWRFRVDRMGIMKAPRVPVAWKGTKPREIYFWTGREWARAPRARQREPFDSILYRVRDDIAFVVAREGLAWNESDTPALAASASLMRYMWVGDIDFTNK
ncbi:MAG: tetratricopeptide repeat protein [Synergistaceae bacterium]|jgi:tetratricopeptide (TPR) repeat protein|nr:tetratricopeptide repeat protein [Synergistaceae bacterium]